MLRRWGQQVRGDDILVVVTQSQGDANTSSHSLFFFLGKNFTRNSSHWKMLYELLKAE